jgi:hypothetical protein
MPAQAGISSGGVPADHPEIPAFVGVTDMVEVEKR